MEQRSERASERVLLAVAMLHCCLPPSRVPTEFRQNRTRKYRGFRATQQSTQINVQVGHSECFQMPTLVEHDVVAELALYQGPVCQTRPVTETIKRC